MVFGDENPMFSTFLGWKTVPLASIGLVGFCLKAREHRQLLLPDLCGEVTDRVGGSQWGHDELRFASKG